MKEREEILNKMENKYKLGKTDKEINKMSYETMCSVLTMIDYDQAEKFYKEGKDGK